MVLTMGLIWGLLGYPKTGRTDDPDSTTGLTSREKYHIKTSWAGVMKDPTESGVVLLTLYFKKFPHAKQLFPFRDVRDEDLPKNVSFKVHCNSVIHAVASMVDSIDNVELLVNMLEKVGTTHVPRKVTTKLFLELKETMIELFSILMKKEEIDAWKKALDVIFTVINNALKKELKE